MPCGLGRTLHLYDDEMFVHHVVDKKYASVIVKLVADTGR